MTAKPAFKSKTIIGAVMMALSLALQFFQVDADAAAMGQASVDLEQVVQGITGLTGFVMVIYGRFKARQPLTISGK